MTAQAAHQCRFDWCEDTDPNAEPGHYGTVASYPTPNGGGDVTLRALYYSDENRLSFSLDLGEMWDIEDGDQTMEMAAVSSIAEQAKRRMDEISADVRNGGQP